MRLPFAVLSLIVSLGGTAPPRPAMLQIWEKPIAPGLVYREEVDFAIPRVIHALRWSLKGSVVKARAELAGHTVYADEIATGRAPVSEIAKQSGAIAAINGDFFSMQPGPSGEPLGLLVRDGEMIALPTRRVAFGWGPESASFGSAKFSGVIRSESVEMPLDGLNRRSGKQDLVLDTETANVALGAGSSAVLNLEGSTWAPSTKIAFTVESVAEGLTHQKVEKGHAVLIGTGTRSDLVSRLKPGQKGTVTLKTDGFDWSTVDNAIGGGPRLLQDGKIAVDAEAENFGAAFAAKRHPRTAIGLTKAGDVWLVVIDGRQEVSEGATLEEAARVMQKLGCTDAMNLDGGGSSTMNLLGQTVNRPSDGRERPVADAIILEGAKPAALKGKLKLDVPAKLSASRNWEIHVEGDSHTPVPNALIVWSSLGSGWIDQGGRLHPLGTGPCTISAWVQGQVLTRKIELTGVAKPYRSIVLPQDHDPDKD